MTNLLITLGVFACAIPIAIVEMRKTKLKEDGTYIAHQRAVAARRYVFFYNNVITRKAFRHIVELYSSLSCYDFEQMQQMAVDLFIKSVSMGIAIPLFITLTIKDIIISGIAVLAGCMYYQMTVEKAYDKEIEEMCNEASFTIQSITDNYVLVDDVTKAVKICERAPCLERTVSKMYDVLAAENKEKALYEYKRLLPIRLLSSLVTACYITVEEGDSRDDKGQSKFVSKMTQLRLEADSKVRSLRATSIAFGSLANLSLTGLIVTPIFDWFLLNNMPGTAIYLKGLYGEIEKTLILAITCLSYYIITLLRRPSVVNVVDKNEFVDRLSKHAKVKRIAQDLIPKTYKAQEKWNRRLKDSLSSKDMVYIYTLKPLLSVVAVAVMTVMLIVFTITSKSRLWNNYGSLSAINYAVEMTETMHRQIVEVDYDYMTSEEKPEDEVARSMVKSRIDGLSSMDVEQQVDRLSTKWDKYYNIKFHWWYLIVIYLAGVAAWFVPEVSLFIRSYMVKFEAAEDAMQLQSLMMTLQSTKYDVRKCLYWLAEESTVHKAVLQYAYVEYASDPELALLRLKDSVSLRDMKRLVAKLEKAMYDLSIEDAFRDISLDKQQALNINEMLQTQQLQSKTEFARGFANAPLSIAIYGGLIIPILVLGYTQLVSSLSEMGV